ncbi:winged helix-turn-helix domain-containing protein [Oricola cellulosilytica]|uniref:Winged helix-turn-helix domain-containing protein n=1 Tax=Oricola cellulosilytica TaxID=1429082 RepID=A0A4R0PCX5_9HYPH|nr:crosslink repair DNA glycosylase YcaQ family protein [Oricola cellulosilytica]TCD14268.1 winged helix-turn-helix domain-containing protein [Oricola cellulosilytica]
MFATHAPLKISNRDARRLWLDAQGLAGTPVGPLDVMSIIRKLGYVQLDTIRVVSRAHHHILWSRNQHYREPMLNRLLAHERSLFEHYTHDASVLPIEFYSMWRRQFRRLKERIDRSNYYSSMLDAAGRQAIRKRIEAEGPLSTNAFETKVAGERRMWSRPPHKLALDYMWYAGELATSHRNNFKKFYDLSERVIPADVRDLEHSDEAQVDWLCRGALDRLAFGTPGEVQRFWDATDAGEVRRWSDGSKRSLVPVEIQAADGSWSRALAPDDIELRISEPPEPGSRLRIVNPFDPIVRDRARLMRLFGFDFRIEIFVPAAKRRWGYYVFPLLEGDRFVGRIEARADRAGGVLNVVSLWPEPGVRWTARRAAKLEAELARFARFVSLSDVRWHCLPNGD